jgi:para-nitrobenzyl esterase
MKSLKASAAIAAAALSMLPAAAQTVTIDSGTLRGARAGELEIYKGIPYAQAKRWQAPAPVAIWPGVRDATAFGADCVHTRADWEADRNGAPMSEDCLFLNIWAPATHAKGGAPVMLWIHGGSFTSGSGSQNLYDGAALAARGVVVVTINYRLGRFGFFAHPALTAEAGAAPTGNWGFMDQVAALKWVRANIRAFGGDPAKVTIFGESAGGGSVNTLMVMPAARGLFARAIAESGGGRDEGVPLATAEAKGKAFAESAGVPGDDLAALRAIPADKMLANLTSMTGDAPTYSGPMIDGRLVGERTDVAFLAGRQAPVPYMVGANSFELGLIPAPLRKPFTALLAGKLGAPLAEVQAAYGSADAYDHGFAGDVMFVEPSRFLAGLATAHHSYLYWFDYVAEGGRAAGPGAAHGGELPFVFGTLNTLPAPATDADRAMAKLVGDYWTAFAKGGNPNGGGRAAWPGYVAGTGSHMVFSASGAAASSAASPALDLLGRFGDARREASLKK